MCSACRVSLVTVERVRLHVERRELREELAQRAEEQETVNACVKQSSHPSQVRGFPPDVDTDVRHTCVARGSGQRGS